MKSASSGMVSDILNITVEKEKGKTMSDSMMFPMKWEEFLKDYSFIDHKEFYTNGARLISTFRVEQMIEHYFAKDINAPSKWIPVTERLPEKGEFVLVFTVDRIVGEAVLDKDWQFYWSNTDEYAEPLFVTHWMPLPEPPKENDN
jgi:hypothetical protein